MNEDLIREVAEQHGVALGRDDPILILQTALRRLMEESTATQQRNLQAFRDELETVSRHWEQNAQKQAERILTSALGVAREAMATTMQDGAELAVRALRTELAAATGQIRQSVSGVQRVAVLNLTAAIVTIAAAALVLWTAL